MMQRVLATVLHPLLSFIAWQCVNCNADCSHIFGCEHHKVRFLFSLMMRHLSGDTLHFFLFQYELER